MTCPRCNIPLTPRDGADVGGLPGVRYLACVACGYAIGRPVVPAQDRQFAVARLAQIEQRYSTARGATEEQRQEAQDILEALSNDP